MSEVNNHKDLTVWKESIALVTQVYLITKNFPKEEMYGLISQIRRCAVSVPSNIAEGAARNSTKEFIQFLYISLGSLSELETQFIISKEVGYIQSISVNIDGIRRKLVNLIKSLKVKLL